MFEAEMSSDAWQIAGMADKGLLPSVLGERNVYGSPTYGILLSASGVICLGWMSFSEVIDMLNLLFCLGQAIEFCAFLHLRRTQPDMPRPFKVPLPFIGLCIMLSFPLFFIGIIISFSSLSSLLVSGTLALSGIAMFYFLNFLKENQFCIFEVRKEYVDLTCPISY
jgi:amino acid transporter